MSLCRIETVRHEILERWEKLADRLLRPSNPVPNCQQGHKKGATISRKLSWTKVQLFVIGTLLVVSILATHDSSFAGSSVGPSSLAPRSYVLASPLSPNATISVHPNATIDLSRTVKQITIEIALNNTPDVPPFNGVQIELQYSTQVLTASSLDYSTNVFSQTGFPTAIVRNCLDGHGAGGNSGLCGSADGPGVTSFAESILGGTTPDGTSGNIFFLTLNINTTAQSFSQIRFVSAILSIGKTPIPTTNLDGYYTSLNCNGVPCPLSRPNFTWSPNPPTQGKTTVFNASSSLPATGYSITDYFWAFGDTSSLRPYRDSGTNSTVTYIYNQSGTYTVTLTITDSLGIKSSKSIQVKVVNANVDMGIESLDVQPSPIGLNPGVVFNITAILKNYGGLPENTSLTLTITINGKIVPLGTLNVTNMRTGTDRSLSEKWDSTGFPANVYRVDATTPLLANETARDPNPNHKAFWIQLIPLQPTGGLSLLGTAGISVLVLGAGGAGVSFIRKRTRNVDDSL
jgi:PKD repeat protein